MLHMLLGSCLSGMLSLDKSHPLEQKGCGLCGLNFCMHEEFFISLLLKKKY